MGQILLALFQLGCFLFVGYCFYKVGYYEAMNTNLAATGHLLNKLMDKLKSGEIKTPEDINKAQSDCWNEWAGLVTNNPKLKTSAKLYQAERKASRAATALTNNQKTYGTRGDFNQT